MIHPLRSARLADLRAGDVLESAGGTQWRLVALEPSPRGPKPVMHVQRLDTGRADSWDANGKPYEVSFMVREER